jgi:hypothetical protein
MVGAAHADPVRVNELLGRYPELAKATIDWGYGDWESALGAASHTGQRQIAITLLEHGARPDIFTFAMLGKLDAVKAMVEAQPGVQRILGPHGISLARHARAGGEPAKATLDYLLSLGDADTSQTGTPLTPDQRRAYLGEYTTPTGQRLVVAEQRELLQVRVGEGAARNLHAAGDHVFRPAGAPSVTFRFQIDGDRATRLRIDAGERIAEASRP